MRRQEAAARRVRQNVQDQEGRLREIAQELKQVRVGQARVEKGRVTVSHHKI